jgi:hypothetical protein
VIIANNHLLPFFPVVMQGHPRPIMILRNNKNQISSDLPRSLLQLTHIPTPSLISRYLVFCADSGANCIQFSFQNGRTTDGLRPEMVWDAWPTNGIAPGFGPMALDVDRSVASQRGVKLKPSYHRATDLYVLTCVLESLSINTTHRTFWCWSQ